STSTRASRRSAPRSRPRARRGPSTATAVGSARRAHAEARGRLAAREGRTQRRAPVLVAPPVRRVGQRPDRHHLAPPQARQPRRGGAAATSARVSLTFAGGGGGPGAPAPPQRSVRVAPGSPACTRPPLSRSSWCSDCEYASTKALVPPYTPLSSSGLSATIDA